MSDVRVITCYFNPCRYATKRANFDAFMAGMAAVGAKVLVVELAFGDEAHELPPGDGVLHLRGNDILWQKERLLNLAAASLPEHCRKIAWLDNDLLFDDRRWLERTSAALDDFVVVQPFTSCVRLARGERDYAGVAELHESYAHVFARSPSTARSGTFDRHGHTGYAWAARRELFETCGLYDVALAGNGDHLMAHGFAGGLVHSPCLGRALGSPRYVEHFFPWAIKARDLVGGKIGYVPGSLLHLWHGDLADRRYDEVKRNFAEFGFDPDAHLRSDEHGLLAWSDAAPQAMRDWARDMFWQRREDGASQDAPATVSA